MEFLSLFYIFVQLNIKFYTIMKNIKKITIILLSFILSSNFVFSQTYKEITVADLWKKWTFWAGSVYGVRSMNDGIHYTISSRNGDVIKYSYETGNITDTVFNASEFGIVPDEYEFNSDESKILFQTNYERIYRRSFTADYYVYDIQANKITQVSENGQQQIASFSPDANNIAFIRKNNMFIKNIKTGKEIQITNDADGKKIAYIKFNESNVKMFDMTVFAGQYPKIEKNKLYPENRAFKYPKDGGQKMLTN